MDIVSLLLIQPNDQIRAQCLAMDTRDLARFTQTSKRIRDVCGDILAAHKDRYEKEKQKVELLLLFTIPINSFFKMKKIHGFGQFFISNYPPDSIDMFVLPINEIILNDFLSKIPNVKKYGCHHIISKNLLSDELKLDILRMAKKLGYTDVYMYDGRIDRGNNNHIKLKSLNEFSII